MSKRKCIFCGGQNLSKEHIFAQWLLKELGIIDKDVSMTHVSVGGFPLSDRKHQFSKLVNGMVCEKCNNGWMSNLEASCQVHVINLLNLFNFKNELSWLSENKEFFAKWAFKNAIVLNSATNYRKLVPKNHYIALYEGKIPSNVYIDVGFTTNDSILEWRQTTNGLIIRDMSIPFEINSFRYRITYQIKNLIVKVAFYESTQITFYEDEGALRIYPEFGLINEFKLFESIDDFDLHGVMREYRDIDTGNAF